MKIFNSLVIFIAFLLMTCNQKQVGGEEVAMMSISYEEPLILGRKKEMLIQQISGSGPEGLIGTIERRGGYSISFPKHSFEIDLDIDVSLGGLPADDDWIVNANFIDKTFLRHVVSYDLFREMNKATNIAPRSRYVELEVNGVYNGLYVLMEKLDKSSLDVDDSDSLSFVFKEPHIFRFEYDSLNIKNEPSLDQQTYPKKEFVDKSEVMQELRHIILSSGDTFTPNVLLTFDIQNLIDWHLLLLITNNNDGVLKNFYLYKKNSFTPVRIAPWDYDHSFGRDGDNEINMGIRNVDVKRSTLFSRLLEQDWYRRMLKQRWYDLNEEGVLSLSSLQSRIVLESQKIRSAALKNFTFWSLDDINYHDNNDFDEEVEMMLEYLELRHAELKLYFDYLEN